MRALTFSILHLLASLLALPFCLPALAAPPATPRFSEDGSGPRAALLLYDKLVGPNQSDKALSLYHAATTRERALAAALAHLDGAMANLHYQATRKFNRDAADDLIRVIDGVTTSDINAARITVTGDTAAVTFPSSNHPTVMVRVSGEWKISVKALVRDLRSPPRPFRKALAELAGAANDAAAKIEQGQHPTPESAKQQLRAAYGTAFPRND